MQITNNISSEYTKVIPHPGKKKKSFFCVLFYSFFILCLFSNKTNQLYIELNEFRNMDEGQVNLSKR